MATVNLHISPSEATIIARDFALTVEPVRDGIVRVTVHFDEVAEAADIYDPRSVRDIQHA